MANAKSSQHAFSGSMCFRVLGMSFEGGCGTQDIEAVRRGGSSSKAVRQRQFVDEAVCRRGSSSKAVRRRQFGERQFVDEAVRRRGSSSTRQFVDEVVRRRGSSSTRQFVEGSLSRGSSSTMQFVDEAVRRRGSSFEALRRISCLEVTRQRRLFVSTKRHFVCGTSRSAADKVALD